MRAYFPTIDGNRPHTFTIKFLGLATFSISNETALIRIANLLISRTGYPSRYWCSTSAKIVQNRNVMILKHLYDYLISIFGG